MISEARSVNDGDLSIFFDEDASGALTRFFSDAQNAIFAFWEAYEYSTARLWYGTVIYNSV